MKIESKIFGSIEIGEERIITFENGILGFPELRRFVLLHDIEQGDDAPISFLQSVEEGGFAMPVMNPLLVKEDYDPTVNDELLAGLGNLSADNVLVLTTVTVPADLTQMSVNLKGPIVINADELKAAQIIVENDDYPVKFLIYDILAGKDGEE